MTREAKPFTRFVSAVNEVHDHSRQGKAPRPREAKPFTRSTVLLSRQE
jgi:hypothetical protein